MSDFLCSYQKRVKHKLNLHKHLNFKKNQALIEIPTTQGLNKQCFFRFILCHHRYGYISLKSLSTWNKVFIAENDGFCCQKQYRLIENKVSMDSFTNYIKLKLQKRGIDIINPNFIDQNPSPLIRCKCNLCHYKRSHLL